MLKYIIGAMMNGTAPPPPPPPQYLETFTGATAPLIGHISDTGVGWVNSPYFATRLAPQLSNGLLRALATSSAQDAETQAKTASECVTLADGMKFTIDFDFTEAVPSSDWGFAVKFVHVATVNSVVDMTLSAAQVAARTSVEGNYESFAWSPVTAAPHRAVFLCSGSTIIFSWDGVVLHTFTNKTLPVGLSASLSFFSTAYGANIASMTYGGFVSSLRIDQSV